MIPILTTKEYLPYYHIILVWFTLTNLKEILRIKYIVFYRDRFRIKTFLGLISRDYFYEEIDSWLEEEKENKLK